MVVVLSYSLIQADRGDADLLGALRDLAALLDACKGCRGAQILRDMASPDRFLFRETWDSRDAQALSGASIPKEAFDRIKAAVGARPETAWHEIL